MAFICFCRSPGGEACQAREETSLEKASRVARRCEAAEGNVTALIAPELLAALFAVMIVAPAVLVILILLIWRPVQEPERHPPFEDHVYYAQRIIGHGQVTYYGRVLIIGGVASGVLFLFNADLSTILLAGMLAIEFAFMKAIHDRMYDLYGEVKTDYMNLKAWQEIGAHGPSYRVWNVVSAEHVDAMSLMRDASKEEYLKLVSSENSEYRGRLERSTAIFEEGDPVLDYIRREASPEGLDPEEWSDERLTNHIYAELRTLAKRGDLDKRDDVEKFTQRWSYWQHFRDFRRADRVFEATFSPISHLSVFLILTAIYLALHLPGDVLSLDLVIRSIFFGVSFLVVLVAAVCAVMLFAAGYWLGLDSLRVPLPSSFGDPIFRTAGAAGLMVAVSAGFVMGIGTPVLLLDFPQPATASLVASGFVIVVIFFTSVYGIHFAMRNTKEMIIKESVARIPARGNPEDRHAQVPPRHLRHLIKEVRKMRIWPVNWQLGFQLVLAGVVPWAFAFAMGLLVQA